MKRISLFTLALMLIFSYQINAEQQSNSIYLYVGCPRAYVNGEERIIDINNKEVVPTIIDDRTLVPIRFLGDILGAETQWDDINRTARITRDGKTIEITAGKDEMYVSKIKVSLDVPAQIVSERMMLPVRAVSEAFDENVFFEDGIIAIGDKKEDLTEQKALFAPQSQDISHPLPIEQFRLAMISAERDIVKQTTEQKKENVADLMEMTPEEVGKYIFEESSRLKNTSIRPSYERKMGIMSLLYGESGDEAYAQRVIEMLYAISKTYWNLPAESATVFFYYTRWNGYYAVAYDQVYNSPYWKTISEREKADARVSVEDCMRRVVDMYYTDNYGKTGTNLSPFYLIHMAGMCVVLNDPVRVRKLIELFDFVITEYAFSADGMWHELSTSYGQQAAGNAAAAVGLLKLFKDPYGYKDDVLGLKFNHSDIGGRYPLIYKMMELNNTMKFPNGAAIALEDTHYTKDVTVDMPIKEEYLGNIELNHAGFYAIKHGNTSEAQQMNLKFARITEGGQYGGGHHHGDFLGLSLWSAGMEILPDGGYVFTPAVNRYFHTDITPHNAAWIWSSQATPYTAYYSKSSRSSTYAYDDGSANNKQVQLIEAGVKKAPEEGINCQRRALFMIATDENHSYTLDVQRLSGGTVHENFLRQVEEEDVDFDTTLKLSAPFAGRTVDYMKSVGLAGGLTGTNATYLSNPRVAQTDEVFSFSWTGKDSGTKLNAFVKGNKGAQIVLSEFPTMRRVNNVLADKDKYPGLHLTQRLEVAPEDVTIFGGVYEGVRRGESGKVQEVIWLYPEDGDNMTVLAKVVLEDAIDYIYLSDDCTPRTFEGITFSGEYAAVRLTRDGRKVKWSYLYGKGSIDADSHSVIQEKDYIYKIIGATNDFSDKENYLKIQGTLPQNAEGLWCRTILGNDTGIAYRIVNTDQSHIYIHNAAGFEVTEDGVKSTAWPMYADSSGKILHNSAVINEAERIVIDGSAWLELKIPKFTSVLQ